MTTLFTHDRARKDPQPADNLILWLPVFLATGIGAYFAWPFEPARMTVWAMVLSALAAAGLTWRWRDVPVWRWLVVAALGVSLGMALIHERTRTIDTEVLDRRVWSAEVTGMIHSFERSGSGWRVILHDARIAGHKKAYVLRLTMRQKGFMPEMGARLAVRASLMPPSPPLVPGSYDFRRHAFFHEIGGYGYVTRILDFQKPLETHAVDYLEVYRDWLTEKVYAVLGQPEAGIVTAMLNGQRAGIARATTQTLQKSGLQHVISISGLHVGLMAITVFYVVRLLLASSMTLALYWPIKKIAAGCALFGIVFYLLIVGSSPPTLRAVIMSGIALIAIMLDREPIQMRVVALSALLILLVQPESFIDIGFQMSFAAVIGMVAFFQQTRAFWMNQRWQESIILKLLRAVLVVVATSVIATVVTAPLVILYFQQIPLLSMLSNVLATLPISFLIMPGTFLAYLLTPFPFAGELAIRMMGLGVTLMMDVAHFVARLPAAVFQSPPFSMTGLCLMMLGIYAVIVVKNRWRWLGIGGVLAGLALIPFQPQPDFLLMDSRVILYPEPDGSRLYKEGRLGGFEKTMMLQWTSRRKVAELPCDDKPVCELTVKGRHIRIIRTVPALARACNGRPDLVLTRYYLDRRCRHAMVVDRHDLEKKGGHAVFIGKTIRVRAVAPVGDSRRPWHRPSKMDKAFYSR